MVCFVDAVDKRFRQWIAGGAKTISWLVILVCCRPYGLQKGIAIA